MSLNSVCISGNLGRDAELRQTQSGSAVLSFSVAVNERRRNQAGEWEDVASWVDCTVFGNRASSVAPYLAKGTKVSVQGRLRQRSWQAKDGTSRSKLEVVVDELEFMSRGTRQEDAGYAPSAPQQPEDGFYSEDCPF